MDKWVLKGARNLVNEHDEAKEISPTQVKVKVTHLLVSNFDSLVYGGDIEMEYPKTFGRFAIGKITEVGEKCYGVKKGDRVYLESAKSCGVCLKCKSGKRHTCENVQIAGRDYDGYLRDFVVCEYSDVAPLPDTVDNLQALCIEFIGIAENIYDKLKLSAGQRVAIIGSNCLGNIIAQVLQYHKVIPIVIDNNPKNLEKVKKSGVYYAFSPDNELLDNVMDATCGELCDAAIYSASSQLPVSLTARLVGKNKTVVLSGFSSVHTMIDAGDILGKNLTVFGITHAATYTDSVINMILHGAVNIDFFDKEIINEFDPVAILEERYNDRSYLNSCKLTVFKMMF